MFFLQRTTVLATTVLAIIVLTVNVATVQAHPRGSGYQRRSPEGEGDKNDNAKNDRRLGSKGSKGGKGGKNGGGGTDDAIVACGLYELFDSMGRGTGNDPNIPGFEWYNYCYEFADYNDDLLCPDADTVESICDHKNSHLNPAVRINFCIPKFENMEDIDMQIRCDKYCTNYVSMDRGNCCNLVCNN